MQDQPNTKIYKNLSQRKTRRNDNVKMWKKFSDAITAVISVNVGPFFLGGRGWEQIDNFHVVS
jgi:uncharacterized sodium:solute symporter family permease YidK